MTLYGLVGMGGLGPAPPPLRGDGFGSSPPPHPPTGTDPPCVPSHTSLGSPQPRPGAPRKGDGACATAACFGVKLAFFCCRENTLFSLEVPIAFQIGERGVARLGSASPGFSSPSLIPPHNRTGKFGAAASPHKAPFSLLFFYFRALLAALWLPKRSFPTTRRETRSWDRNGEGGGSQKPLFGLNGRGKAAGEAAGFVVESECWGAQFWGQASPKHRAAMVPTSQTPQQRCSQKGPGMCVFQEKKFKKREEKEGVGNLLCAAFGFI